jgi:hypothetical protein
LIILKFRNGVNGLRNDGVVGSNPISGTIFLRDWITPTTAKSPDREAITLRTFAMRWHVLRDRTDRPLGTAQLFLRRRVCPDILWDII